MSENFPKNRDYVREYLLYLQVEKGLAKNSLEAYERDLQKLRSWAEKNGFDLLKLTRKDLREWLIDLAGEKLSENSKRRAVSALRGTSVVADAEPAVVAQAAAEPAADYAPIVAPTVSYAAPLHDPHLELAALLFDEEL